MLLAALAPLAIAQARDTGAGARPVFQARAVRIQDGDSLLVRPIGNTRAQRVRIAGIDAPERHQADADASRELLRMLTEGQALEVRVLKHDVYGRSVARILVDGGDVGLAMISSGHAWYFRRYRRDLTPDLRRDYAHAENRARQQHLGLWREQQPEPPWRYRQRMRADRH